MAEVKLTILGTSKDGYKVSGSVEGSDFTAAAAQFQNLKGFAEQEGWQPDGARAAAAQILGATPAPQNIQTGGKYTCVEDGTTITDAIIMNKPYSAQELAQGRAKKSVELNLQPIGPRCDDCWKKGGYAGRYKALKGFS